MNNKITKILVEGGVGVIPTDTMYGLVGSALNKKTVERIYKVRKRNLKKPLIVLISSLNDLKVFGITLNFPRPALGKYLKISLKSKVKGDKSYPQPELLSRIWPGKITLILPLRRTFLRKFEYLHRGSGKIAFRLPKSKKLIGLLEKTGPLVAPSANIEGEKPAKTISEAKNFFGESIDFYFDEQVGDASGDPLMSRERSRTMKFGDSYYGNKKQKGRSSTILEWREKKFIPVREGAVSFARLRSRKLLG